jgi:hypothetical protein
MCLTGIVLAVLIVGPVVAMADRVVMKNGSSFEVRGFKITEGVVTVALSDRTWSVPPLESRFGIHRRAT